MLPCAQSERPTGSHSGKAPTHASLLASSPPDHVTDDCFVSLETTRSLGQSTIDSHGQRAAALRFGDRRVMALLGALATFGLIPGGLSNKTLRQRIPDLLGVSADAYSAAQMSYDLRRLRLKGIVARIPKTQQYVLTELGAKILT